MGSIGGGFIAAAVMNFHIRHNERKYPRWRARLYYAMAQDGMFFAASGVCNLNASHTCCLSCGTTAVGKVLVISGSFDMLTDMLIFVSCFWMRWGIWRFHPYAAPCLEAPRPTKCGAIRSFLLRSVYLHLRSLL